MTDKPNILFIYSDQHRYDCLGVNGHPLVKTPNLDRLAKEGANFTRAHTPSPISVPARCSLLTGQWPSQHGCCRNFDGEPWHPIAEGVPVVPEIIQASGYKTIHVGRWHVNPKKTPLDYGFNEYLPDWRYGKWRNAQGLPPIPRKGWQGNTDIVTPEQAGLGWASDKVIDYMDRQLEADNDPFFLRWHMLEPHLPCHPPEPFASMYDPADIEPWDGFYDEFIGKPWIQKQMQASWGVDGWTWDDWAPIVARYLGTISYLDSQIGKVLDYLEEKGIADNTLVIYTSDHGDMCGDHGMVDKHNILYDAVTHVPMFMRWRGVIPAGSLVDSFVSNVIDMAATFCHAAGTPVPDTFAGQNLLALIKGEIQGREDIFSTYSGNQFGSYSQRMVRDKRWKYIWNATAKDELYDCDNDSGELNNLATNEEHFKELSRLRLRLIEWMQEVEDPLLNFLTKGQLEKT